MDDLFGNNNNDSREQNSNSGYDNNNYSNNDYGNNNGYGNNNNNGYYGGNDYYRRDNYGYYNDNSYGGGNMPQQYPQNTEPQKKKGIGFALTALIVAVVNILICKSIISIVTVPLCLVFAILSLAGKRKGKVMAIISIVLSVVSAVIFGFYIYLGIKIMPDMMYFMENSDSIIEEFEEDGTIPERFEKYREPKFDRYWKKSGYADFDEFFADYIKGYKSGYNYTYNFGSGSSGSSSGEYSFSYGGNADL